MPRAQNVYLNNNLHLHTKLGIYTLKSADAQLPIF